ncbi:MAG: hypothetical protein Q8941_08805 [Bacteroidota bacterium]|nr:hypothetical protein [Bacteroidota bacterium]
MKKTAFILGAAFLFQTATINAQTDTLPKEPAKVQTDNTMPRETVMSSTTTSADKWNNYSPDKYKMLPMPGPLTTAKIFPVIGHYSVTSKSATTDANNTTTSTSTTASSDVTIALDESNKGIAWIEGLPQGKIKAYLRKSPAIYKIPAQKIADDKDLPEGVLVYNKDANTLDICIGCAYNNNDPAAAFTVTEQPVVEEQPAVTKTKSKFNKKGTAKAKIIPVKTWKYSGSKTSESTASIAPMQQ